MAATKKKSSEDDKKTLLKPKELVASSISEWKTKAQELLTKGVKEVEFDLSATEVVDSTGIGLLIQIYNSLSKIGGIITIKNPSANLLDLFRSMQLDKRFNIT